MNNLWFLAQSEGVSTVAAERVQDYEETAVTVAEPNGSPAGQGGSRPPASPLNWMFLAVLFVALYFMLFRGPRRKQQQQRLMVQSLQKNDKVQTIGGLIGTIIDVKDDELTLKIDESNNTKIKILPSAVSRKLAEDDK